MYAEVKAVFLNTLKYFEARGETTSQAYRLAWSVPLKFYIGKTPEEACDELTKKGA